MLEEKEYVLMDETNNIEYRYDLNGIEIKVLSNTKEEKNAKKDDLNYREKIRMSESPMDSRPTFGEKLAYLAAIEEKERKRKAWHKKMAKQAKHRKKRTKSFLEKRYADERNMLNF